MSDFTPSTEVRRLPGNLPSTNVALHDSGIDSPHNEVQLREYWRLVFKYRSIIVGLTLVGAALAAMYAFTATPMYTAQSKIRISTYEPVLTATKIEDLLQQKSKESNYLETQVEEIRSYSLADKVLEDSAIRSGVEGKKRESLFKRLFGRHSDDISSADAAPELDSLAGYKAPIGTIKAYLDAVEVAPVRRTSLVLIKAVTGSPQLAALIANKHALTYIDWVRSNRIEQQSRGLQFLRGQADELREKVADLEREMADYAEANSIVALNKDENITAQKMSQLNKLLTDSTAKRIEAENVFKEAQSSLGTRSAGYDDQSLQVMRAELAKLEGEYQQLSAKFTPNYPRIQQLKSQIDSIKQSIDGQRKQIVSGLKAKALAAAEEEKNLKEELEQQKSRAFELSKKEVQYNILNRELTTTRELLDNVLKQIKETSLAVESNASNVSVVDYASVPTAPSHPKKFIILVLGLIAGLCAGVLAAFVLNYLDNTVKTPEEVKSLLRLPNLGVVPSFTIENSESLDREGTKKSSGSREIIPYDPAQSAYPIVFVQAPKSLAAEAYRTIRTGLLLSRAGEPPRTLLVTSAQSSEGKTTSSINLAVSLASAGGRVILVDADLRRPSMYRHFQLDSHLPGLVDVITGQMSWEEVALKDIVPRVTVIPSGQIPPNPAELLGSLEMATLIDQLSASFDYVVIDSPPILPVTDSVILSRYVEGVVLVVKGASTPRRVISDARARLKAVGANLLGVVLNDVDVTGGDYYYYNRYYHSYYRDEDKKSHSRASGARS
ncbi:MAG: polysaccharide biosynthesis tyrosine autokinase [Oligoflexia bacterium]|nr:polysaccharide biosynthesis tyrosine autokinase [Oligoflexia bacterium]